MKENKNTLAFPNNHFDTDLGMTLRDYFANSAMQGMMSRGVVKKFSKEDMIEDAKIYYAMADAMLKQREL